MGIMAHYAFLDKSNVVTEVITGRDENEVVDGITDWEAYYGELRGLACKRTSYWTYGGKHSNNGKPFRMNYAHPGFTYDEKRDAFIPYQPFPSWILNDETCLWEAPITYPTDGKPYRWDEETLNWVELPVTEPEA